ncbi:Sec-independent protein translocase subunit TatA/TatB [Rickettsia endosymbiont of Halotydeus destructor]|uniref:Sec-independent protein translocase subunit TatA/TatB n=1 Tax=Rickettsia endosymbiont of Halotydeus destructor TaxID=2996754 RepID=UPI003BB07A8C
MSLGEIIVVILIALLVIKPEDIPIIMKKIHEIKSYFTNFRNKTISYIINDDEGKELNEDIEQLNFYLQKVISINGKYDGDYTLEKVKQKYHVLTKESINKEVMQKNDY